MSIVQLLVYPAAIGIAAAIGTAIGTVIGIAIGTYIERITRNLSFPRFGRRNQRGAG